ncbi:MAG TPA: SAM-dependent methyltransferase, partial [Myxococcota bacterium]|nr:SAM-dependent methyltransferase [Myxococcota bacterium]
PRELAQGLAQAGLATTGVGFAHALHTPYWALRSLVGLRGADASAWVRAYRVFLLRATQSRLMDRIEKLLNYVCPKSVVLYARKAPSA